MLEPAGKRDVPTPAIEEAPSMRFFIGLITGVAVGIAAATISQGQAGQGIRAEFDLIRRDLEKRDFDAIGTHLEERFNQLQASLEERFAEAQEAAEEAAADAEDAVAQAEEAAAEAEEAVEEAEPVKA
jgi:gas vesicle protein